MKSEIEIQKKIDSTLEAADQIREVKVSPFLKENILHQLQKESQISTKPMVSWFSPVLQWATFVVVIAVNVYVIAKWNQQKQEDKISSFTKAIGLDSDADDFITY